MRNRSELADHQPARVTAADTAGERPFAAGCADPERMLDVELKCRRTAGDRALQPGFGKEHVHPALRVGERLHDRAMRAGLLHASDEPSAGSHDHPGLHAVRGSAVDLQRAAEPIRSAPDDLRRDHVVAIRALEVQRLPKGGVLLRGRIQLDHLAAQCFVGRRQPLVLCAESGDVSKD